ncbi:MAG: Transcriptional regulator containing domain, AraC family [Verrucomicrobiota bacterium]|jgi:AraC-like DNA-binding protein
MPKNRSTLRRAPAPAGSAASPFAEAPAWVAVGGGWRPLFGNFRKLGFSFEWHEFHTGAHLDWARSFHPGGVELCLNLEGTAALTIPGQDAITLPDQSFIFYHQGDPPLQATRRGGQRHRFITVEFSPEFLQQHFRTQAAQLHPLVRAVATGEARSSLVTPPERLAATHQQLVESLRHCPVFTPAQEVWFRCKALELAAHLFFRPPEGELFCTRARRAARSRVDEARAILRARLQEPPSLEELGRLVGCSPFHLSRLFSQEAGLTIQQFIRQSRMERAAELLRSGRCNVTEAALEVGYNSLSHFSSAFHETYGCCPGLYPIQTPAQKAQAGDAAPPATPPRNPGRTR